MTSLFSRSARAAAALMGACVAAALIGPASAQAETLTFSPGPEQTFVVPSGVTRIHVTAIGQTGGGGACGSSLGCFPGKGEKVVATLTVKPGQKLFVDFVGGGAASGVGGAGGNAADLRTISSSETGSLASRILVAGGGGAAGEGEEVSVSLHPGSGGNAGSTSGEAGLPPMPSDGGGGGGATQSKGGAGGPAGGTGSAGESGQLGVGGKGGANTPTGGGGGGGGGYYGGGGGGAGSSEGAGGGGGSSFVAAGAEEVSYAVNTAAAAAGVTITYAGGAETVTFNPGPEQSFVVPVGVSRVQVVAIGRTGGESTCGGGIPCAPGAGERVAAALSVQHGQKFYADFVGGGAASGVGGAGGNAADLRTISSSEAGSLASRLIVAGGGGGAGEGEEVSTSLHGGSGGNAGSTSGEAGQQATPPDGGAGGGATQTKGGSGGLGAGARAGEAGQLGKGGKGGFNEIAGSGGGGGGGYYGGGGGGAGSSAGAGGGGGSSFATASAEEVSFAVNTSAAPAGLSITYRSAAPPTVSIVTPGEGATYTLGQSVSASFTCAEGSGGPGLLPGSEGCSGTVANGAAVNTSTSGEHHFTVTANSKDGLTTSKTATYTVVAPPSVSITTPAAGATYLEGQTVDASYTCAEGAGGPGLKPGSEGCSGTVADGAAIETSTLGEHHFTVTANSKDGQSTGKTVSYTVVAPPIFGRCVKATKGKFKNSACTQKLATATGKFEWSPGVGPKPGFSLTGKPASVIRLETTKKNALRCTGAAGGGKVTGLKTVELGIELTGCTDGGESCTNTGTAGSVVIGSFDGTLGWSSKAARKLDLKLVPTGSGPVPYFCPNTSTPNKIVELRATGILLPVKANVFSRKATDAFTESGGKQVPSALEGEAPLKFEETRTVAGKSEIEGVGLGGTLLQTYEEGYEINTAF